VSEWHVRVITGRYADSVRLMGLAKDIRERDGVERSEIGMGTPANLEYLRDAGVEVDASPSDVVVAVRGEEDAARESLSEAERALAGGEPGGGSGEAEHAPRTLAAALSSAPTAGLAMVSVPGEYAALEAHRAISAGLHVFLFSDHVSTDDERALKARAVEHGLLMMGPGAGTAMLGGVGLGFANKVRAGSIGVVAAAGTGAQEVACLIDAAGGGVSQIIGVGGRDLTPEIGGLMFRAAMELLDEDESTESMLLVSKPPDPEVVRALADPLPTSKPVIAAFVGAELDDAPFPVHSTLDAAAYAAAGVSPPEEADLHEVLDQEARRVESAGRSVRALYSGGTLAYESLELLRGLVGPVAGNLSGEDEESSHELLDLGEEEYTEGRPHPMVALDDRAERIAEAGEDAEVGCILLDVVLGYGSHEDPSAELGPAIEGACQAGTVVVLHVCGTDEDPQDGSRQTGELRRAGAIVAPTNAIAARLAGRAVATQ
jgi:FdrA protein